ncbi:type VI secretion system accessory protein TagJ [Photobacterium lutimaris]|uniref:Protein of avirulence locus ImpE n=1 Tax=Photobacterium lutimaris TaxID=388278 RepID=A0A2T3IZM6_9GAMM|nr:type VI secretion system accessory protein TagJ [Photobacterium lutimaris]PSU34135.1 protein of avirulence locus ImpE [Photobacterium lutimaris]
MKQFKLMIQQGKLSEALDYLAARLKQKPMDVDLRSSFVELLCIDGQLERADKQLNVLIKQSPECLVGATNLRQLIRAAQARLDFENGAATATLVKEPEESFSALLRYRMARYGKDTVTQIESAMKLEEARQDCPVNINGEQRDLVRDLDDTLAGYLEVFGTNGQYYLVPFEALISLELKPITSLIEQVWRKVEIEIEGGLSGEAFIPMTYAGSDSDGQKLARETDWLAVNGSEVYQGVGQKMVLFGNEALTLSQVQHLSAISMAAA